MEKRDRSPDKFRRDVGLGILGFSAVAATICFAAGDNIQDVRQATVALALRHDALEPTGEINLSRLPPQEAAAVTAGEQHSDRMRPLLLGAGAISAIGVIVAGHIIARES